MMEEAFTSQRELVDLRADEGLEASMRLAESMAVGSGTLDATRSDGRLFTEGPQDPFLTERQQELASLKYTYDIVPQSVGTFELQSLKTWEQDGKPQIQALPLGEFDTVNDARREQTILRSIRDIDGLETEMSMVERIAIENGTLQADRDDPRLFTQGPADPFRTQAQLGLDQDIVAPTQPEPVVTEPIVADTPQPSFALSLEMDL
jgi:hypothetical protein